MSTRQEYEQWLASVLSRQQDLADLLDSAPEWPDYPPPPPPPPPPPNPDERMVIEEHFAFRTHDVQNGGWCSGLVTVGGDIYAAYVNPALRTVVSRNGETADIGATRVDKWHNMPSLGVDETGLMHCAYNMHHYPYPASNWPNIDPDWLYKQGRNNNWWHPANSAYPPGTWISYYRFTNDRHGHLYVSNRQRVAFSGGWRAGQGAAAIARLDGSKWTALGGNDYQPLQVPAGNVQTGYKSVVWWGGDNGAQQGGAYAWYSPWVYFDKNNRMHVSESLHADKSSTANHLLYFYSDDDGNTFRDVRGNRLSMPVSHKDTGCVVVSKLMTPQTGCGVNRLGQPYVCYRTASDGRYKLNTWEGNAWRERDIPGSYPCRVYCDDSGVLTSFADDGLHRSHDNGQTWKKHSVRVGHTNSTSVDEGHLRRTGELRFTAYDSTDGERGVKVLTARFV